jgi:hypothetical protein
LRPIDTVHAPKSTSWIPILISFYYLSLAFQVVYFSQVSPP